MHVMPDPQPREIQTAIVELRQYTLHAGKRDVLIDIFERDFIEPQELAGMRIIGQFRERNNPDLFVWLRGFPNMPARREALEAFYTSAIWVARRDAVNDLLIDSDNVLLLRPARLGSRFPADNRPVLGGGKKRDGVVAATVYSFDTPPGDDFLAFFEGEMLPVVEAAGAARVAELVTEASPNTFPRLPVREGEQVFVWFARFSSSATYERYLAELGRSKHWRAVAQELDHRLARPVQTLELVPTARSALA